jgi:hypothetical protein
MRRAAYLLVLLVAVGCGGGGGKSSSSPTTPTPTGIQDSRLWQFNARFAGGTTFRWRGPVPFKKSNSATALLQAHEWGALIGVDFVEADGPIGGRLMEVEFANLPGDVIGEGNPFALLRQPHPEEGLSLRQISRGETVTCRAKIDRAFNAPSIAPHLFRHEIGHCLGFIGHTTEGSVMDQGRCCPLSFGQTVEHVMRRLYELPIGTAVRP